MAHLLATQVQNPDEDNNFTQAGPKSGESKQQQKEKSCWWKYFCCCCAEKDPKPAPSKQTELQTTNTNRPQENKSSNHPPGDVKDGKKPIISNPDRPLGWVNPIPPPPLTKYLLPPLNPNEKYKKCLVLDLDETLVHSSFKPIPNPDFVISIELENVIHKVYVRKRPGVDNFLRVVGEKFEVVVFTASLAKYADPLLDILDKSKVVKVRLFREACVQHYGNYVKDLTHLGRPLEHSVIIDNSPFSYMFQPDNAIPITSWFNDRNDRQLYDLIPFLDTLANCDDVVAVLQRHKMTFNSTPP